MSKFTKGQNALKLWTVGTPNGIKVSILLEELKIAYGLEYDFHGLSFSSTEQKEEEFLEINPNGRIPALTDYSLSPPLHTFESGSIQLYLVDNYDPKGIFWFNDKREIADGRNWLMYSQSGVGPMQGQSNHFVRYAPEKIPYGITRYTTETRRLYSVLEDRLAGKREGPLPDGWPSLESEGGKREYIVGRGKGKYSIVDMNLWPWVRVYKWAGLDSIDEFPNLKAWLDRIASRQGVKAGIDIPTKSTYDPDADSETQERLAKEAQKWIMKK